MSIKITIYNTVGHVIKDIKDNLYNILLLVIFKLNVQMEKMKIQFDPNLECQQEAIKSVTDIFGGQRS